MDEEGTSRLNNSVTFPQERADKSSNGSVTCFRAQAYWESESDFVTWLFSAITRCPYLRLSTSWTVSTFGTSILSFTLARLSIAFQLSLFSRFPEVPEVRPFPWLPGTDNPHCLGYEVIHTVCSASPKYSLNLILKISYISGKKTKQNYHWLLWMCWNSCGDTCKMWIYLF